MCESYTDWEITLPLEEDGIRTLARRGDKEENEDEDQRWGEGCRRGLGVRSEINEVLFGMS